MMERHRKCLKALSRDKENGDTWKDKMEAKYGLEI